MSSKPPGPSQEERSLQTEQTALLRQQRDILQRQLQDQNLLLPQLLEAQGLEAVRDEQGKVTEFRPTAATQEARTAEQRIRELTLADIEAQASLAPQEQQIRQLQTDRQLAALRGELPVDPALERSLGEQGQTLRERLFAQLGPGFETSTPGIQTLAEFGKRGEELRSAARRAELTVGEQLRLAGESGGFQAAAGGVDVTERLRQSRLGEIFGSGQFFLPSAQAFGGAAGGFGGAAEQFARNRMLQQQFAAQQAQGFGQIAGTAIGAGIGAYAAFSSRMFKTDGVSVDPQAVLEALRRVPVEAWKYRPAFGGTGHIGPYAEDVHREFGPVAAPNGVAVDLITMNGLLMLAVQALADRVQDLEGHAHA